MNYFRFIIKWGFFCSIWIAVLAMLMLFYFYKSLPDLDDLKNKDELVVKINYNNSATISNSTNLYRNEVQYYELPRNLVNAIIAIEDRRFFSHIGIDYLGILRAFYVNHKKGHVVQGGSTITQQLAKLMFLSPKRNITRKIQEALLALQLEREFSKEQILTFYLNRAYFGAGNYGIKSAAKGYFGKDVSQLNLNESTILAGLLKAPSKYSPKNNKELAEKRAMIVLKSMIDAGFINQDHISEIDDDANYKIDHLQRLYFVDYVKSHFAEYIGSKYQNINFLNINTTLDEEIQEELENIIDDFVIRNQKKLDKSQIAVIIMAKEGAILAVIGGRDYQFSQFNRAFNAKRQTGSAFKSLVYLTAFDQGYNVDDIFTDQEVRYGSWLPQNYNKKFLGEVTLKEAFAKSLNSVAIQLGQKIGLKNIALTARKLGISSKIKEDDLTVILGSSELSLLEIVSAYGVIANGGRAVIPYMINDISDDNDNMIYQRYSSGLPQIIKDQSLLNIKDLLRQVVLNGTGSIVNKIGNNNLKEIYGKTGTSQNYRDAWFVGFDDRYVIGVWIGNDDNSSTNNISGGSLPAKLFGLIVDEI